MLTIRKQQMAILDGHMRQSFENRMVRNIAANFVAEYKGMLHPQRGDADVRSLIQRGVAMAAAYGVEAPRDVAGFIHLMVAIAPDFTLQPKMAWAAKILHSTTIPKHARMEIIFQQLPQRLPEYGHLSCPTEGEV